MENPAGGGGASDADRVGRLIGSDANASSQKRKPDLSEHFAAHRRGMTPLQAALARDAQIVANRPAPSLARIKFLDDGGEP